MTTLDDNGLKAATQLFVYLTITLRYNSASSTIDPAVDVCKITIFLNASRFTQPAY